MIRNYHSNKMSGVGVAVMALALHQCDPLYMDDMSRGRTDPWSKRSRAKRPVAGTSLTYIQ